MLPNTAKTHPPKNKTIAAWLAFIFGQLGIHRLYLFGIKDLWAWVHPIAAALLEIFGGSDFRKRNKFSVYELF